MPKKEIKKNKSKHHSKQLNMYTSEYMGTYHMIDPTLYTYEVAVGANLHSHLDENKSNSSSHLTPITNQNADSILTGEKPCATTGGCKRKEPESAQINPPAKKIKKLSGSLSMAAQTLESDITNSNGTVLDQPCSDETCNQAIPVTSENNYVTMNLCTPTKIA